MPDSQMMLLPKENYYEWVAAARDYVLKFGCNLTPDPQNATMTRRGDDCQCAQRLRARHRAVV